MSKSNRQYIFDALELLPEALKPFVETRLSAAISGHWQGAVRDRVDSLRVTNGELDWDLPGLLKAMMSFWGDAFKAVLGPTERAYVSEILEIRNRFAHDNPFSYDDTERALDTVKRLLEAISAGEAAERVSGMRTAVLRRRIDEQRRNEERKAVPSAGIRTGTNGGLRPWRDVIRPHDDVASGKFQTAEFAADLSTVHSGKAGPEYRDPREFFSRTYLTAGLSELLVRGAERLSGKGGDPVVELQTNFGGGKTHSMLALYHMCGEVPASGLFGLDQLLSDAGVAVPEKVKRAVIVGTARSPVNPIETPDGLTIRTTWGDLAYQLGGTDGYALVAENDRTGISPGSELLSRLFAANAPCLILIDECVAYLRHLYKAEGLPAGSFDTNLSFVQALTEAVKVSPQTFLVASLPQSQIEVGGEGGEEALKRLRQTFTRVNATWSPATTEESYEIVRRRLFRNVEPDAFPHRDNVVRQFAKLYREDPDAFPTGCAEEDYRRKLEKAYPIHPELFPTHARCPPPDGHGHLGVVATRRFEPADHAGNASDGRSEGRVGVDEVPRGRLGPGDPHRHRRRKCTAAEDRLGQQLSRPLLGDSTCRTCRVSCLGTSGGGSPRDRHQDHHPWCRPARRGTGPIRRRSAPPVERCHLPLRRWCAVLVLVAGQHHPPCRRPGELELQRT